MLLPVGSVTSPVIVARSARWASRVPPARNNARETTRALENGILAPPFVHTYNPSSRHGIDSLSIEREAVYYTLSWVVLLYYSEALSRIMFALTGIDRAFHSNRFDPDRGQPVIWVQHQSVGISDPQ